MNPCGARLEKEKKKEIGNRRRNDKDEILRKTVASVIACISNFPRF